VVPVLLIYAINTFAISRPPVVMVIALFLKYNLRGGSRQRIKKG